MNTLSYKTISANSETVTKEWLLVDAENEILGRLATKVAMMLQGQIQDQLHAAC
jgi:large subunit ribosomal protein L13